MSCQGSGVIKLVIPSNLPCIAFFRFKISVSNVIICGKILVSCWRYEEPVVRKINKEKSLIVINISINKTGLIPLGDDIEKYDIFIDETTPLITWFGPNKITVKNHIGNEADKIAHCRFTFYTSHKGLLEVNRICVLLYKRFEGMTFSTGIIQINHITKPLYLEIE